MMRVVTEAMLEAIKEAHRKGESIASVARRFNLNKQTLVPWAKKLGLKFEQHRGMRGKHHSLEAKKKIGEMQKGKHKAGHPRGPREKTLLRDEAIVNDYMRDKDQTWRQLARKHKIPEAKVREIIGEHLMRACRASDECPFKLLLPEYKVEEVSR